MFFKACLQQLYLEDKWPWLVGSSGGKDSAMLGALIFDVVLSIPAEQRKKPISVLCTDTRVEIPAIAEMIEGTLDRMRRCSQQHGLNIEANLLKTMYEESSWVNIIGQTSGRRCLLRLMMRLIFDKLPVMVGIFSDEAINLH